MRARSGRWRPAAFAAAFAVLLLGGCTGTQEGGRPVLIVVATTDHVGLVEDPGPAAEGLRWLPAAEQPLPPGTTVVDLAIARAAGPDDTAVHAHLLTREDGAATLRIYDATAVPVEEAGAFEPLDTIVLDVLLGDTVLTEGLCATDFDVSDDGRWLAFVHEPSVCGASPDDRSIVLIDREADPDDDSAWTLQDGDYAEPAFATDDDSLFVFDDTFVGEGRVAFVPIPYDGEAVRDSSDPLDIDAFSGFGIGGAGRLVVAGFAEIVAFDPDDEESLVRRESSSGLVAVVDAELLPGAVAVVRTGSRLVVHRDLDSVDEPVEDEADVAETSVVGLVDAVVGPDSFIYALAEGSLSVIDVLSYLSDAERDPTIVTRTDLPELANAVAVDWVYGAFPEGEPETF